MKILGLFICLFLISCTHPAIITTLINPPSNAEGTYAAVCDDFKDCRQAAKRQCDATPGWMDVKELAWNQAKNVFILEFACASPVVQSYPQDPPHSVNPKDN